MTTGLLNRGGRYATRRRIPLALVPLYGKAEVVRALGTSDRTEAKRLHALMWVSLDREFAAAQEAADKLAAEVPPLPVGPSAKWRAMTPEQRAEWQREKDDYELGAIEADERGQLEPVGTQRGVVADAIAAARLRWEAEAAAERAAFAEMKATARPKAPEGTALSAVMETMLKRRPVGARYEARVRKAIEDFQTLNGQLTVEATGKPHVLAFMEALVAKGQSPANANLLLGIVGTVFIYAMDHLHLITSNPAARIRLPDKRRDKDKRRAFEEPELQRIFHSRVYAEDLRPAAGGGEASYWLPLLALYTGARQTELGQLHPDDVMQEAYRDADDKEHVAWVIRIVENAARGQTVKNEGSERRVPIHADLIKLGFVRVAQAALANGQARIFPDIVPARKGILMGNWSKWFGRYRRKECALPAKDTPFHSFRHTFKHYARLSRIPNEVHNEFTGHETGDVADTYGGMSYPLHPLVEGMKQYRVPGLKLPALSPGLPPA
jgi:integrase